MQLEYNVVRKPMGAALVDLKQKLSGYRSYWDHVYIGVTSNPKMRAAQHQRNGWGKMVVLYEAFGPDIAATLEKKLIAHAHQCKFKIPIENINPGGEGIDDEQQHYFLYVLVEN